MPTVWSTKRMKPNPNAETRAKGRHPALVRRCRLQAKSGGAFAPQIAGEGAAPWGRMNTPLRTV